MNRTRARSLTLVNWRGVFYERYELDPHVTALEGANGAGKTTVMIAAYLVLLPDLGRLKFTNLGESGASGGDRGIEGRLGRDGSPSYAAIEFDTPRGQRLLAIVQLVAGRDSRIELRTALVTDLAPEVRIQELLLHPVGESEQVPELAEVKDAVARVGARMTVFSSAKDYFQALFDHGVTPLRLTSDEEKTKLNEMLRTSMTGGISRSLTNDLRSFLLRPETALADTLATMRSNLEACRRTREEVATSRVLNAEITGVYEAGEEMFAAALHATRERAAESRRMADRAREQHEEGQRRSADAELALERAERARQTADARMAEARERAAEAEQRHQRLARAAGLAARWTALDAEATAADQAAAASEAASEAARTAEGRTRDGLARSQEAWRLAASGLAHQQQGLSELYRRAEAHRQVTTRLAQARDVVGDWIDELGPEGALSRVSLEQAAAVGEAASVDTRIRTATHRRDEHARVLQALTLVIGHAVPADSAHERAREALARHAELRALAVRRDAIARERESAERSALAQRRVRSAAAGLGLPLDGGVGPVHAAHDVAHAAWEDADRAAQAAERLAADARRAQGEGKARISELEQRCARWRDVVDLLARLGRPGALPADLDPLERELRDTRDRLVPAASAAADSRDRALRAAHELETAGGSFAPDLVRIASELGGELLATRFDDLDPAEAGPYEARRGPLAEAIVVPDALAAAAQLGRTPRAVDNVWLVEGIGGLPGDERVGPDVVVRESAGVRVSRIPDRPTLGRRARQARVAELRRAAAEHESARLGWGAELVAVEARGAIAAELRARRDDWAAGDPGPRLEQARTDVAAALKAEGSHREEQARHRAVADAARRRTEALRGLLPEASLLAPPDWAAEADLRASELDAARAAAAEVARTAGAVAVVDEHREVLRTPPPTEAELAGLRGRERQLQRRIAELYLAAQDLAFVVERVDALGWGDAEGRLSHERALVPELEASERAAKEQVERDADAVAHADAQARAAVRRSQDARGEAVRAASLRDAAHTELCAVGVGTPTEGEVAAAAGACSLADEALRGATLARDAVSGDHARRAAESERAAAELQALAQRLAAADGEARPHEERWGRLERLAAEQQVLGPAVSARFVAAFTGLGSPNLSTRARTAGARLVERLRSASRAGEVGLAVQQWIGADEDRSGEGYLEVWRGVLDWLRRRLPAHVAEVDDPLLALGRLQAELVGLEQRLTGQEAQLRGHTADVASHIEVQIRRAVGQVQQINRHLEGVAFGAVASIRVRSRHLESMARVLAALREEGEVQALLFEPSMPFEEALDALFRRYGGGGSGGQRLLDYREYIELHVEVRRRASAEWEAASATKLSTGEAIGVGAAVMMVVLAEWERDANLLRGKRSHGSLRFLFLDEANRLDRGNLDEVFELCRTLELQLLVAAPEVARAGGITTYRLERVVDGSEERVCVSGRRARTE
ncbi:MAG: chromosome partition protein MukB [Myxococcota bacterium]